MKKPEHLDDYWTVSEIAKLLGVSSRTVERWYAAAEIDNPLERLDDGTKLWSPMQVKIMLDKRIQSLPSVRKSKLRIIRR